MQEIKEEDSPQASANFFRKVWADSESAYFLHSDIIKPAPLGWILGSVALILILVVGMVAYLAIKRSEFAMSNLLVEKGSSLLQVFESALRTGMRGDANLQLQALLEEITKSPDIEFVAVTMPDGIIVAHSDHSRIGEILILDDQELDANKLAEMKPDEKEQWQIVNAEGERVFLLYRHFTLGQENWEKDVPEPTIFLGLDVSPFEITRSQNRSYVAMLSVVTLLVGLSCLLALCYAQRAAESRLSQKEAESEVKRLEEEVRRNEKLAAVGTLAAGVAHEIRNPLSSIKGYATYFCQRFPDGSDDKEAAAVMVREVDRLNRVITDLLGLSKPGDAKLMPIKPERVAEHVLHLIRPNVSEKNINVIFRKAPVIPIIMADLEKLNQALLNLCLNAIDAMSNGGTLTIAITGGLKKICIMVCDTGCGIPQDIIRQIFDPYFTTKGSGTGLGLPMAYKILKAHNGHIDVKSYPPEHKGENGKTIFKMILPINMKKKDVNKSA